MKLELLVKWWYKDYDKVTNFWPLNIFSFRGGTKRKI